MLYTDRIARHENSDDIKTVILAGEPVTIDPDLRRPAELPLLVPVHRFHRIAELDP